jgi:hypothetical protein
VVGDRRELAYKAWRFTFRIEGRALVVERARSGYRPRQLAVGEDPALELHRRFVAQFPTDR